MANGTTKRAPTGVVGAWKLLADPVGAAVTEAPSCDASMWSPLLQLVAVCCPDGCDEVSDTGKGLGPLRGSGLHTPAYGDVTGVVRAWTAARFGRSFGGGEHPGLCGTDCRRDSPASPAGPQDGSPCGPDQRHGAGRSWLSRDSSRGPRTERSTAGNPSLPGDVGITEGPLT